MARTDRAGIAFLRTHHSTHRILFRFFAKKTELKNTATVFRYAETGECFALQGLDAGPGAYPASDVQLTARQSATFCRFVYVTKCGFATIDRLPPAPMRSDIGNVDVRLGL